MDKERTQTNGLKDKKVDDDAQGIISMRWQRQIIRCQEKKEEEDLPTLKMAWMLPIEDSKITLKRIKKD